MAEWELPHHLTADAEVPCGTCRLCCTGYSAVLLLPERGDKIEDYECADLPQVGLQPLPALANMAELAGAKFLKFKDNGDCHYLGPQGCTIHGKAPFMCRTFDCREQHRMYPKHRREQLVQQGILNAQVLRRGAILLHQEAKTKKKP